MRRDSSPAGRLDQAEREGLVVGSGRGGDYAVELADGHLACRLRGRIKLATGDRLDRLVIGDRVTVRQSLDEPERGVIESVLPRHSQVSRGRPGKQPQIIAANLDQVLIVVAVFQPDLSLHALDRFLGIAAASELPAAIVLNKMDLEPTGQIRDAVAEIYEPLDYPLLSTSAESGEGLALLAEFLRGRISAVVGPSGAGKSSLLNAINPDYQLRTGEVMDIGKGRHTTTDSRLLPLDAGGYVADTPGIKTLQLVEGSVAPRELQTLFPEIDALAEECRFDDCTHRTEPDCAVRDEVGESVAPSRYESYLILYEELETAWKPW